MSENNFKLKVQAVLDKVKSVANIKADIKAIESKLPKLKIQGTLNTTSTRKELNSKLKSIKPKVKVDADTTQAEKKIKKIGKQKTNATITPTVDTTQVVSGLKKAQKETKTLWERFVSGAIGANLVRMSVQKVTQAIHEAVKAVKELDTIKTNIQMVSGTTNSEVNSMMQSYNAMAKELSSTTREVGEAANEFLRMGESIETTNELIRSSQVLSKTGMIESADAASYLISSLKGYQIAAKDSMDVVSKLVETDTAAAVSAGGLAEAISRCASIANNSGTSMDRLIGYAAAIGEVTQESMSVVGNSMKTLYSRFSNLKLNRFVDDETGESLSDVETVLNKLGIQLRETEDTYRNFDDVLDDIAERWGTLTQVERNAVSVAMAGTMQRNRFLVLMDNFSNALEYSEVAANSAGSSLERYGVYQESIEAKTNELTAAIESLSTNIISEDLYSGILQATTGLVEFLDKTNLLKGTLAGLVAMGVSKAIVSIGTGFITAARSTAQLSAAMALFNKGMSKQNLLAIGAACKGLSDQQLKLILSTKGLRTEQRLKILEGMGVEEQERKQMLTTLGFAEAENVATASTLSLRGAFRALGTAMAANPIGAIVTAVSVATMVFTGFNNAMEEVRQKAKDLGGELKNTKADIEDYKAKVAELYKTINDSGSAISDVTEARRNLMTIQDELIDKYGIEKAAINDITDAVDGQSDAFDRLAGKQWQEAKNGFNDGGFMNNIANWVEGYKDNIERMVSEMENVREVLSYSHTDYQNADYTELKQLLENLGWTYNYSLGGFEKNGSLKELYNEILEVQRLTENFDTPQKFIDDLTDSANGAKEVIDSYGDMWDTYILQERIFANGELADSWHEVNEAYSDYQKAFVSGDEESITKAKESFAEIITRATEGLDDQSVIDYFNNMYPELQSVVGEWKFNTAFDANTDDLQTKVQSVLDELKDEDGRSLTAEEILGLGETNAQYQALVGIAHTYNMTIEEMIELLKKRNLVSNMDYQGLVGLFGQDNVDKLSPEDLEIAYTIKNVGNMTFEQLQDEIQKTKEVTEEPVSLSISSTIDQLNTRLKPAFDVLTAAWKDIFTDDEFALNSIDILSTCDSIKSKLDGMKELGLKIDYSSYEDFVRVLQNSESTEQNVKDAFDSLAASITSAGLSGAEDFETLKAALEDLGVMNEELVAFEALTSNTEALKEAGLDLASATEEQINAFANEMVSAENVSEAIAMLTFQKELCGLQDMNTAGEVANLLTLAENAGYTGEVIQYLTELEQIYQEVASGTLSPGMLDKKLARAEELQGLIKDSAGKINYEPKVDFNSASGKKSASKAGKEAADAYLEAFEKELSELDDLKSRGKITEKQYLDALRKLYVKYFNQKKKYLKEFEKYEHQYLDGMKSLYESAFSYITKQIDKRIDAINAEKDAAVSALEAQRDAELEEIETKKEQYEIEIEGIEKEIKAKEKEIKAMQDANKEREHSLGLQKAEYDLHRMQNQRTANVYKDGQMVYEADTSGIRDAKQEVDDIKLEIDISKIEKEIDYLESEKELRQDKIDLLDKEAEKINKYYDDLIAKEEQRFDAMIKGMEDYKSQFEELTELFENAQMEAALSELGINMDALLSGSQEEFEKLKTAYIGILADMSRGNDEVIGQLSRLAGVNAESVSYLESTKGAFENLGAVTLEGLENSVDGVGESTAGLTTSAGEASTAMGGVQGSIDGTSKSITPLNEELEKLNKLITTLTTLLNGIEFPEPGDEGYVQKLKDIALAFGEIAVKCAEFKNIDFASIIGTGSTTTAGNGDPLSGGSVSDTQGQHGTGFMGLASAISEAVETISGQMDNLQLALQVGNDAFEDQINKIQKEYLPAWEELQTRLAEIIGVGGGDGDGKGDGKQKSGGKDGGSESGGNGNSIIDIMQTGGDEVAARLEDPWLKAFNDFATDGDNSIQSICDKIIEMVKAMAEIIQEQCAAAANALNALAETADASMISVGGSVAGKTVSVTPHAEGTVGKAFAKGTGGYKGLPHDEKNALRSEYGQKELTVYPDGKAELTTEPTMSALPKGTVIFNEEQTRQIMKNKGEVVETYKSGTVRMSDGTVISPEGKVYHPLSPSDPTYQMVKKFEEYFAVNKDAFVKPAYAMNNAAEAMKTVIETINNNNTVKKNEINIGDIHLHEVQDADRLSDELIMRFPNKILQKMNRT